MANKNPLARFALYNNRITTTLVIRPKLFEPNKKLEVSVARIEGLDESAICCLGVDVARKHPDADHLYGWGGLDKEEVYDVGLQIEDDPSPSRHSNIVGWPEETAHRKMLQSELASRSQPTRLSSPKA